MTTILIVAFGSRGDVDPYTGLGVRLQQAGYHVAIAACERYADLVRDTGLEYRWLPKDPQEGQRTGAGRQYTENPSARSRRKLVPELVEGMRGVGPAIADAARDADILLPGVLGALFGTHVAEGLGIPSLGVFLLPTAPTGDFPPVVTGTRSFGRWGNRALSTLGGMTERVFLPQVNELRTDLGLRPTSVRAAQRFRNTQWPTLFGFSEAVVPRPSDWHPGLRIAGYWWPARPPHWEPSTQLVDFLSAGPPPVFVGLGSTAVGEGRQLSETITAALRKAGVRGVVQAGAAGLDCSGDDILTVSEVPHAWLLPQMSAAVHHAGAGTTAAALHAGIPTIPVPGMIDQPFWARRLTGLGLAPTAIPRKDVGADRLADAIGVAINDPRYRQRTQEVAAHLDAEDGAGEVLRAVETRLGDHAGGLRSYDRVGPDTPA